MIPIKHIAIFVLAIFMFPTACGAQFIVSKHYLNKLERHLGEDKCQTISQ
jgi:hypothetical protein